MLMTDYHNDEVDRTKHALEDCMTIAQAIRHSGYTDQYLRRMAKEGRIYMWNVPMRRCESWCLA